MLATLRNRLVRVSPVGLDVGSGAARAAQVRRGPKGLELVRTARCDLRRGEGDVVDVESSADRVRRLLRQRGFAGRSVVAGIGPPDAELHALELPPQAGDGAPALVDQAARVELERLMQYEPEDVETAHWWLPEGHGGGACAIGVAALRSEVLRRYELCRATGLECLRIDTQACALARFGHLMRRRSEGTKQGGGQVWGVLDLGHRGTRLALCIDDAPVLARSLGTGGAGWTQSIARWLEIQPESAEVHKRDHGLALESRGVRPGSSPPSDQIGGMILRILEQDLGAMASQIERSYAYVLQCYRQYEPSGLLLVGGGAAMKNLGVYLAGKLGIEVRDADRALSEGHALLLDARPPSDLRERVSEFACAIGLALPGEGGR